MLNNYPSVYPKTCNELLSFYKSLIGKFYADGFQFLYFIEAGLDDSDKVLYEIERPYLKCDIFDEEDYIKEQSKKFRFYIEEDDYKEVISNIFDSYEEAALYHELKKY